MLQDNCWVLWYENTYEMCHVNQMFSLLLSAVVTEQAGTSHILRDILSQPNLCFLSFALPHWTVNLSHSELSRSKSIILLSQFWLQCRTSQTSNQRSFVCQRRNRAVSLTCLSVTLHSSFKPIYHNFTKFVRVRDSWLQSVLGNRSSNLQLLI